MLPSYLSFKRDSSMAGARVSIHHYSVCRSNWKQMIQVVVITHILRSFQFCGLSSYLSRADTL